MTIRELINCCEDKKYARFLNFVRKEESRVYPITNIGTILNRVPYYARYEQIFSAGFDELIDDAIKFRYSIKDIPKGLIKLCQTKKIKLSNNFVACYKQNPDACFLAYNLEYISLTDEDIYEILSFQGYRYDRINGGRHYSYFTELLNHYGYTAKALMLYIDQLKTFEAIDDMGYIMRELFDYVTMMKEISNKFDKYPRHFLTTHKIACRNYQRLKKQFEEDKFKQRINKDLEFSYKGYKFIYPNSTDDIKEEAAQMNNCVASYIDRVIDGTCHILFLRKKDRPDESLVTIEVRDNKIVQARRRFNDPVTQEDQEVINKWNEKFSKEEKVA